MVEAVTVKQTFDLYVGLKSANEIHFWKEGEGPEDSRPKKFKKWAKATVDVTILK